MKFNLTADCLSCIIILIKFTCCVHEKKKCKLKKLKNPRPNNAFFAIQTRENLFSACVYFHLISFDCRRTHSISCWNESKNLQIFRFHISAKNVVVYCNFRYQRHCRTHSLIWISCALISARAREGEFTTVKISGNACTVVLQLSFDNRDELFAKG